MIEYQGQLYIRIRKTVAPKSECAYCYNLRQVTLDRADRGAKSLPLCEKCCPPELYAIYLLQELP